MKRLESLVRIGLFYKLITLSAQVVQWNQRTLYIYSFLFMYDSECFLLIVH